MAKDIVKKDNALVNASYTLTLAEQRLILLAVTEAAGEPNALKSLIVRADRYAEQFHITRQTAYEALKDAASQLFERRFSFQEETPKGLKTTVSRWVSHISYIEGGAFVDIAFAPHVQPLLCDLQNKFTYYGLEQVASLTSVHAVRLYELLISWRSTGKTPIFEINDFRRQLGIEPDEYPRMDNFKRRVLDSSISQINEHTDIFASYKQHKQGRTITGFSFTFLAKKNQISNVVDIQTGTKRSKPKRHIITKAEAEKMARPGESHSELYQRLSREYVISD